MTRRVVALALVFACLVLSLAGPSQRTAPDWWLSVAGGVEACNVLNLYPNLTTAQAVAWLSDEGGYAHRVAVAAVDAAHAHGC